MKKNESTDKIICLDCKYRAQRTLIEKAIDRIKDGLETIFLTLKFLLKYNLRYIYSIYKLNEWMKSSETCIEKYEKIECSNEEHAIFIVNHKNPKKRIYIFASGVDILVNYFISKQNPIKFRVYNCHNSKQFWTSVNRSKAPYIWIIGHGDRHGVSFSKENGYFPFCNIAKTNPRLFIAQLHCCGGSGMTLWEYLSEKPGIFSEGLRDFLQNRDDIERWIKENQKLSNN